MTTLPHDKEPFLDASGRITRSWRAYLASLAPNQAATAALQQQIDTLKAAINASSGTTTAQLQAIGSLSASGTLSSGFVALSLEGDAEHPGATYYYGTNATGTKGFFPVPVRAVNGKTGTVSLAVSHLSDVDSTQIADKKVLAWDAASNKHVYAPMPTGGHAGNNRMSIEHIPDPSYTLTQAHLGKYLRFTYSQDKTANIPSGLPVSSGTTTILSNQASGTLTISPGPSMALNGSTGVFVLKPGEVITLVFLDSHQADCILSGSPDDVRARL